MKDSTEFELRYSEKTLCGRPYSRRGQSIFELLNENKTSLAYNETLDTTTSVPVSTTAATQNSDLKENATKINWKMVAYSLNQNFVII